MPDISELNYTWMKFRTNHSSGFGLWDYQEICHFGKEPTEDDIEIILETLDYELNTHSEHWRGIEYEFENPSSEYLINMIRIHSNEIISTQRIIDRFQEQIKNREEV